MKRKLDVGDEEDANGTSSKRKLLDAEVGKYFRPDLFDNAVLEQYASQYAKSMPYKHGVIPTLIDESLLRNVRNEIRANISFTPKETDIYKIHQSGDLANLDGLGDSSLKLLPSLITLRDALYSAPFRKYLSAITNSGPLSGSKTDMAVNVYTPGCHLLCHDDVIGSRKVSYILYLMDPDTPWQPDWGGALRLYPTATLTGEDGIEALIPSSEFSKVIPPAFGQLAFFAVQPGESFHDVEEVYRPASGPVSEDAGRIRMAISGWYHVPQPGEEGFREGAEAEHAEKSSLAQLQGKANQFDLPETTWLAYNKNAADQAYSKQNQDDEEIDLTEDDLNFLLRFMNPRYLVPDTVAELAQAFSEDSSLRLGEFLSAKLTSVLQPALLEADKESAYPITWNIARPPHKHRFLYWQPRSSKSGHDPTSLCSLVNELFPSLAFKKWLSLATGLSLTACNVLARRFRRGLDYTLATTYDEEDPRLELCLGLTPTKGWGEEEPDAESGAPENGSADNRGLANPTDYNPAGLGQSVGGYEVYMAGEDDEDEGGDDKDSDMHGVQIPSSHTGAGKRRERADPAIYRAAGSTDNEDEGILMSMPAEWNTLSIVLRDQGVLRFVKYVSASAPGDRWDVAVEFKVDPESDVDDDDYAEDDIAD